MTGACGRLTRGRRLVSRSRSIAHPVSGTEKRCLLKQAVFWSPEKSCVLGTATVNVLTENQTAEGLRAGDRTRGQQAGPCFLPCLGSWRHLVVTLRSRCPAPLGRPEMEVQSHGTRKDYRLLLASPISTKKSLSSLLGVLLSSHLFLCLPIFAQPVTPFGVLFCKPKSGLFNDL